MILPIKPICKKSWARRNGTSVVFIQYCHNSDQRALVDSGIAIPPEYWNRKNSRISNNLPLEYGNAKELEAQLSIQLRRAEDLVGHALSEMNICPISFLKEKFASKYVPTKSITSEKNKELDVFSQIDQYIKDKQGLVKPKSLNVYRGLKAHLQKFQNHRNKPITFKSFDLDFYEQFLKFLNYDIEHKCKGKKVKGYKRNTVGRDIKRLKIFLRDRMKRKVIPFIDLTDYKAMEEDVDSIFLTWEEISRVYHLDLSARQSLEKYRDLFVLGCLTGFRFSDYSELKPEEVREGMLYVWQKKTQSTVIVPLREDAKRILITKYKMQMPQVSSVKFNARIKEIAKLAGINETVKLTHKRGIEEVADIRPKCDWVTSHTCRRSFCTNEYLAGTPSDLIMSISGHTTEKSFKKYIKADKLQRAHMIKKLWAGRGNL
jgi:hypothetical protein